MMSYRSRAPLLIFVTLFCLGPFGIADSLWETRFVGGTFDGVVFSPAAGGLRLAPKGENLLVDPGFDAPADKVKQTVGPYGGRTEPTNGWEHNGLAGKDGAVRAASVAQSNGTAWELVDTMSAGEPALLQRVPFRPEHRGKRLVFSLWARTMQGRNNQAMIALKWLSKGHWRCDRSRLIVVTPEWQEFLIEDVMPQDADELGVAIGPSSYAEQGAIVVDDASLCLAQFRSSGTYTSPVHDTGDPQSRVWKLRRRGRTPTGASVRLRVRTGASPTPDAAWCDWREIAGNPAVDLDIPMGRHVQYQAMLETPSPDVTPVLERVEISYGSRLGFVAGRVLHPRTKAPVNGALVTLGKAICRTGADGKFLIGMEAGECAISARALHYLDSDPTRLAIKEGERLTHDIPLKPDPSWWTFRCDSQRQAFSALSGSLDGWGVAWRHPLGRRAGGNVVVEDVTGDNVKEILVAAGGSLAARDLKGNLFWQVNGWELGSIKGVYDIMGDGQKQIVCVSAGWWPYANGSFTVVNGLDGQVLSRVDMWPDAGDIGHGDTHDYLHGSFSVLSDAATVVADLDGDGRLEILAHPNYHSTLLAYHFHDGLKNVKLFWQTQGRFKYDLYVYPLLADDVDGDGKREIIFHDSDMIRLFNGSDGAKKGEVDLGCTGALFGPMACKDVDGDGRSEIFIVPHFKERYNRNTVACAGWNGDHLAKRWLRDFDEPISRLSSSAEQFAARIVNVDNDKAPEMVLQVGDSVRVFDAATGKDKYRIDNVQLKAVEDVNGDGVAEITVVTGNKTAFFNATDGKLAERALSYPPDWSWSDWGDGELSRWRWGAGGGIEVISKDEKVKATLPVSACTTAPIAADMDGNGKTEILVRDPAGRIRVLDGGAKDGARDLPFAKLKCDGDGELSRGGGITARDLDGDGRRELVFRQGGRLKVTDCKGEELFASEQGGLRCPTIGKFNGDGIRDVACRSDKRWTAFDWKNKKVIWDAQAPESNEVATWDVDGDGLDELAGKHGPVFLLNGADGRTMWQAHQREMCALGLGTFADLDGDEQMEVLITGEYTNTAWRTTGEQFWWIGWSSGGAKEHYGAVADVNGDGALDLGLSSNHGVFYCVDGRTARELWTFKIPQKVTLTHPAAADLDGDGKVEFVFGANTGLLIVLNGEDGSVARTIDFGYPVDAPIVADVDNDGEAEVLLVCDSHLCCIDGAQKPFLLVTEPDIGVLPARMKAGQETRIRATIRNIGGREARDVVVEIRDNDKQIGQVCIPVIAAGQIGTAEISWTPAAGRHLLKLAAKAGNVTASAERPVQVRQ